MDIIPQKSASQRLHEFLVGMKEGYHFTIPSLHQLAVFATLGEVSGFVNRAKRKGMIEAKHTEKGVGKFAKPRVVYELISSDPWGFKKGGRGSEAGRTHMRGPNSKPPVAEEPDVKISVVIAPMPEHIMGKPIITPLSERLLQLASEVELLERKSIRDYSTDALLQELHNRIKARK